MKHVKRLLSAFMAIAMLLGSSMAVMAQDKDSGAGGKGSITIKNASKGVVYTVHKVFDAKVSADGKSVSYTKTDMKENDYFEKDSAGNIKAKEAAYQEGSKDQLSEGAIAWIKENGTKLVTVVSDGSVLKFTGLPYGYYYVSSTLKEGGAITVTSAAPEAEVIEKNSTEPQWTPDDGDNTGGKSLELEDGSWGKENDIEIGDTVTFRLQINTSNYVGDKQIKEYIIEDAIPEGFTFDEIISVKIGEDIKTEYEGSTFPVKIPWAVQDEQGDWTSIYDTGTKVEIKYMATLNEKAVIAGAGNQNKAQFFWNYTDHTTPEDPEQPDVPDGSSTEDHTTTRTYAIVLQKVDDKGNALAGAEFELPASLKVSGANGVYVVDRGKSGRRTVVSSEDGIVLIKGLKPGQYQITETKAPEGYNKLTAPFDVVVEKTDAAETDTVTYLDADGNITQEETEIKVVYKNSFAAKVQVVVNKTGKLLPGTGGAGTKILKIAGLILFAATAMLWILEKKAKKRS